VRPSNKKLTRWYLHDLVVDIRCARRMGLPAYEDKCIRAFRRIWRRRHRCVVDRYGVPIPY
jgi:hypothetical protein